MTPRGYTRETQPMPSEDTRDEELLGCRELKSPCHPPKHRSGPVASRGRMSDFSGMEGQLDLLVAKPGALYGAMVPGAGMPLELHSPQSSVAYDCGALCTGGGHGELPPSPCGQAPYGAVHHGWPHAPLQPKRTSMGRRAGGRAFRATAESGGRTGLDETIQQMQQMQQMRQEQQQQQRGEAPSRPARPAAGQRSYQRAQSCQLPDYDGASRYDDPSTMSILEPIPSFSIEDRSLAQSFAAAAADALREGDEEMGEGARGEAEGVAEEAAEAERAGKVHSDATCPAAAEPAGSITFVVQQLPTYDSGPLRVRQTAQPRRSASHAASASAAAEPCYEDQHSPTPSDCASPASHAFGACSNSSTPRFPSSRLGSSNNSRPSLDLRSSLQAALAPSPLPAAPAEDKPSSPIFTPRALPGEGLLHLSPHAPQGLLGADECSWRMSSYRVVRQLYQGYASNVAKASCLRTGEDVVLKSYNLRHLSDFLLHQVLRELDIHRRLQHPHIVRLHAAFREGDTLVLVQEYARGGSLDRARRKLGGRMTEAQAHDLVLHPMLSVLHHLHTQGIIHRDIKPENVLFTPDWQVKVCDFGVSVCLAEERAVTRTGSREYMAPEVHVCPLKRTPEEHKDNAAIAYSSAVDIYSLGVLAYELLVGFTPLPAGGKNAPRKAICPSELAFPGSVSEEARSFVRWCLYEHPGDRPTVHQLLDHAWMRKMREYIAGQE